MFKQVYIVGAGSGDPELLTIKAARLLERWAEIVIYDRLIPEEILQLIPPDIERVYAGKSCKNHSMTQGEINEELVRHARLGKKVLRLKGGDPFIFGRGGEEAEYLAKNNITYGVVPGISAASGISSQLSIPLTHRGVASSVRFITGHQQKGKPANYDWKSLANEDTTLVIYMGLSNIDVITKKLIEAGLSVETPAIAIENGTMTNQRICKSNLAELADKMHQMSLKPPTIVIIGKVVGYCD